MKSIRTKMFSLLLLLLPLNGYAGICKTFSFVFGMGTGLEKSWQFDSKTEAQLSNLVSGVKSSTTFENDGKAMTALSDALIQARVRNAHPITRLLMWGTMRAAMKRRSLYSLTFGAVLAKFTGPHYNPLFNRIAGTEQINEAISGLMRVHELTHALHRNINPILFLGRIKFYLLELFSSLPMPFETAIVHKMEEPSIGSQWEVTSRIPPDVRDRIISALSTTESVTAKTAQETVRAMLIYYSKENQDKILAELEKPNSGVINAQTAFNLIVKYERLEASSSADDLSDVLRSIDIYYDNQALAELTNATFHRLAQKMSMQSVISNIVIKSLEYAHLTKEEFIEKMRPVHGYTFKQIFWNSYGSNDSQAKLAWRSVLVTFTALTILSQWLYENDYLPIKTPDSRSQDIKFLMEMYAYLL